MGQGPYQLQAAISAVHAASDGKLNRYQPYHAARADLLARSGKISDAVSCYKAAFSLSENKLEKEFLTGKVKKLAGQ